MCYTVQLPDIKRQQHYRTAELPRTACKERSASLRQSLSSVLSGLQTASPLWPGQSEWKRFEKEKKTPCTEKTTSPSYCLIRMGVCDWKLLDCADVVHLIHCENLICRWLYAAVPPAAPRPPAAPQGYRCQWSRPGRFSSYSGCYPGEGWPRAGRRS